MMKHLKLAPILLFVPAILGITFGCQQVSDGVYNSLGQYVATVRGTPLSVSRHVREVFEELDYTIEHDEVGRSTGQIRGKTDTGESVKVDMTQLNQMYSRLEVRVGSAMDFSSEANPVTINLVDRIRLSIDPEMELRREADYPDTLPERYRY